MKRLVPLWMCAVCGFVLIVAYFIPFTQGWGEVAAIWFDILAAIAFVLGGGNLLKIHLKKVSDRTKGFGYSIVVLVSFLGMLFFGLMKWAAPPAPNQEFYGETWATMPLEALPVEYAVDGEIPERGDGDRLHDSFRRQLSEAGGRIVFRGWMRSDQKSKLLEYDENLAWQCSVETLYDESQPGGVLAGRIAYYTDHDALSFTGHMTVEHREALLALGGDETWAAAVESLFERTQSETGITVESLPTAVSLADLPDDVVYDPPSKRLVVTGPMTEARRAALDGVFPTARPLDESQRAELLGQLRSVGEITPEQEQAFARFLAGSWTVPQLHAALDAAGKAVEVERTPCEMLQDQAAGRPVRLTWITEDDSVLNGDQVKLLHEFAGNPTMTVADLVAAMKEYGPLKAAQASMLRAFLGSVPTAAVLDRELCEVLMRAGPLDAEQRELLLSAGAAQFAWQQTVGDLFVRSHVVKFPWSGEYRAQGTPFHWLYEYAFKPLQATIFAMLAFYVASAAFRAFRAKNVEAILLLGTAFIILLGRTFAGVFLTSWMPEALSGLKIENLTVTIMQVFNTAGNRAIMIGIALGIASTSLKVLLGVDRSYLGSGDE